MNFSGAARDVNVSELPVQPSVTAVGSRPVRMA